ncbi:hypothetical protein [Ruminococcus sp.]|uniref:hypothetical protein n=1 Tax=Ruminococcus sp. TaxID=41978 RepID=UPI00388DC234
MMKFREWISIQVAKHPKRVVLVLIILFNILFISVSAALISSLSLHGTEKMNFFHAAYYTVTMILDAGCIEAVIKDIGTTGVALTLTCLAVIIIGMITFTGAVIGYLTNILNDFIEKASAGNTPLYLSNHTVILNWNARAPEIVNDLLYSDHKETVVALVKSGSDEIKKEIEERLHLTIEKENAVVYQKADTMRFFARRRYLKNNKLDNNVTFIAIEGNIFSQRQLMDIRIDLAKAVIILSNDPSDSAAEDGRQADEGNPQAVKALMQTADIVAAGNADHHQNIIIEITDPWTSDIVQRIISGKDLGEKCNIVMFHVEKCLGQLLAQLSITPEMTPVYDDLFSNKGAAFYTAPVQTDDEIGYIRDYLSTHQNAIPLTLLTHNGDSCFCFAADNQNSLNKMHERKSMDYSVKLNKKQSECKRVIMIGHNSKVEEIMSCYEAYIACQTGDPLKVTVIDDGDSIRRMDDYRRYSFVEEVAELDIFHMNRTFETIQRLLFDTTEETSILILSDDTELDENADSTALMYLVYIQDAIKEMLRKNPGYDKRRVKTIVEITDPRHYDIVKGYDMADAVISNRFTGNIITQIGEKESIYDFYKDLLRYTSDQPGGQSRKPQLQKVSTFFRETPPPCTAYDLVRAVFEASVSSAEVNPALVLGTIKADGETVIFSGDLSDINVSLEAEDKVIVYTE